MLSIKEINLLQAQNEGLKKQNAELQSENFELKESLKCFQKPEVVKVLTDWRTGELDNLKAENERLKEENVKLLFGKGTLVEFCNKLTQIIDEKKESENKLLHTLQEIKDIAEEYLTDCQGFKCEAMEEIIQKITKAESEE